MNKSIVFIGAVFILIAVILGAFGAHGLEERISPARLNSFETGVRYQFYSGLSLLVLGLHVQKFTFCTKWVFRCIISGTILFSLSIYFLSIQEIIGKSLSFLGPITPIGGGFIIAGWVLFCLQLLRNKK